MSKIIFLDVETGGLDETKNPLLTLGACCVDRINKQLLDTYYVTYRHNSNIYTVTKQALKVNGLNIDEINSDPSSITHEEGAGHFAKWLQRQSIVNNRKLIVAGHNLHFDKRFIVSQLRMDWNKYFHYREIDTQVVAGFLKDVGLLHLKSTGLDALASSLGIKGRSAGAHNALDDAKVTARCYLKMVYIVRNKIIK